MAGEILITGGDVMINQFYFVTEGYQPPHYPRAITYTDHAVASGDDAIVMVRDVVDQGPMLGVWNPFTVKCLNADDYNGPLKQKGRGQQIYDNLWYLYSTFIGQPVRLWDSRTDKTYNVCFTADGFTPTFESPTPDTEHNPITQEEELIGMTYNVQISFFEIIP